MEFSFNKHKGDIDWVFFQFTLWGYRLIFISIKIKKILIEFSFNRHKGDIDWVFFQ